MDSTGSYDMDLPPEIVERYVTRRFVDIEECITAVKTNNYKKVAELAHQMKGNGASFGFGPISEIGSELEIAAKNQDRDYVCDRIEKLHSYLKSLK